MYTALNSSKEIDDSGIDIAILSSGATEQCGPFLPLAIDTACAEFYARAWGEALNAFVLPTFPFNTSEEHAGKKGTITLSPQLMMNIFEEIIIGLIKQGFKKFVITGGHGGAYWVGAFIKHLNYKYPDNILIDAHIGGDEAWQAGLATAGLENSSDIHGGELSACLAAYLFDLPYTEVPAHGQPVDSKWTEYLDYMTWDKFSSDGSIGVLSKEKSVKELRKKGGNLLETYVNIQSENLKTHFEEAIARKGIA
ncbi:MAG: creatininase family protein [Anaerolineae bacterium]|jgi:creatinine amidohydrolase|nr:creatininase family protein [Anaerolineae bacterium]MBT7075798.1 creatininase family protein [Anaerolineae bacterium]MBT7781881.1 creatininase family protein [Anaerolineae bacterium]